MIFGVAMAGCSTTMHGTAPAKEGFVYAAGSKVQPFIGEQPEVWLCSVPKKGPCQLIQVTTEEH
ncbi:MAG: hypothetical protein U0270_13795 [Labilithrix sp.]